MPLLGKGGYLLTYNRFLIYRPSSSSHDPNYLYHKSSPGFVPAFPLRWYQSRASYWLKVQFLWLFDSNLLLVYLWLFKGKTFFR